MARMPFLRTNLGEMGILKKLLKKIESLNLNSESNRCFMKNKIECANVAGRAIIVVIVNVGFHGSI